MSTDLQLETDLAMAQRPGQKQWPTDECATALQIPKASIAGSLFISTAVASEKI